MIPLVHDFSGQRVLVFGGGSVGSRKARRFAAEAHVVVVSPAFDGFEDVDDFDSSDDDDGSLRETTADAWTPAEDAPGLELVRDAQTADDVDAWLDSVEPALVVAATNDDAVNERVAAGARDRGILVNRTDRAGERDVGSVVVPATVEDGSVTLAITTGGASPALSKYLREQCEVELEGAGAMADLTRDLRRELKASELTPTERRAAVRRVVRSSRVWKALRTGTPNARKVAEDVMRTEIPETAHEGGES